MAGALPHVVHVISTVDPRAGGTTTQLVALIKAEIELGMTVTVVSTYPQDFDVSAAQAMQDAGAYLELIGPSTAVMAWHPKISRVLRDTIVTANIVHIHGLWEEIQHRAAVIARELDVPFLFSLHGTLEPWSMQQSRLKKQIYMAVRMKKNLATAAALHYSDETEQQLTAEWRLHTPAIIQPYAADLELFERLPASGIFRRAFPQLEDSTFVLFLGRLHPRKGLDLLIPAFAQVKDKTTKLVIAGPSSQEGYEGELRKLVAQHGLTDRVLFPGMLEGNVRTAAYVESRVFVLPSHSENFGLTVIESCAAGTPVIVSDHVALAKQVEANQVGQVVPLEIPAIAEALNTWLADPERAKETGEVAREWALRTYNAKSCALAWSTYYDEIIRGEIGLHHASAMA